MRLLNLFNAVISSPRIFIILSLTFVTVVLPFQNTLGADITEITKWIPADGKYADFFGSSVSIRGDYAIVGAPSADTITTINSGAAYIFERSGSTWIEIEPRLLPNDKSHHDAFGSSVSISGDYVIVGKPFDNNLYHYGAAYIFKRSGSTWSQEQKLYADDRSANDFFGTSVWIAGDYAIVGVPFDDDKGSNSGSAYIFERSGSTWSQVAKLVADDGAAGDNFGNSVSISGNYAIVGAHSDDNSMGANAGCVYFFQRSEGSWGNEQKFLDINGDADDAFGWSVAIYGNTAIVGAYKHDDDSGDDIGSATIVKYWNDFWLPSFYLKASDRAASDSFGYSVSISANYVVVGAFNGDGIVDDTGAAYVFQKTSGDDTTPVTVWDQLVKLISSDGAAGDRFGYSVSISGPYAIVGATQDINSAGSVYLYDIFAGAGGMPAVPLLLLFDN